MLYSTQLKDSFPNFKDKVKFLNFLKMGGSNRPILFAIGGIVVGIGAGVAIGWFSKVRYINKAHFFIGKISYANPGLRTKNVAPKRRIFILARERRQ